MPTQSAKPSDLLSTLQELSSSWSGRAVGAYGLIRSDFAFRSRRLSESSFLAPLEDELSRRLLAMRALRPRGSRTTFQFKPELDLYAGVWKPDPDKDNHYEINIYAGLVVNLFMGAAALTKSGSRCSSNIVNTFADMKKAEVEGVFASQAPLLQVLRSSPFELPSEPWRQLLAYGIFQYAIEFIFLHELAHIGRGHLKFLTAKMPNATIIEDSTPTSGINNLTFQLMECQADDSAASFLMMKWKHLTETHDFHKGPLMLNRYGFSVLSSEDAFRILSYAVCLLFVVIDAAQKRLLLGSPTDTETNSHPIPAFRTWRALEWHAGLSKVSNPWISSMNDVCADLEKDKFPGASTFPPDSTLEVQVAQFDKLLQAHSVSEGEGAELVQHELAIRDKLLKDIPKLPMPPLPWGEKFTLRHMLRHVTIYWGLYKLLHGRSSK